MSKLTYKIATASIAVMTIASLSAPALAQVSTADLMAQINALQAQLLQLQGGGSSASSYTFTKNLTVGARGEDVKQLQSILIAGGYLKIAAPTSFFGPATRAAVIAWQQAVGISPTSGFVGPLSRARLNSGLSGGTGGTPTATESYLKVEAVPSLGGTIPSGSLYNKILNLKLTAGKDAVVVTGITATRGGFIANTRINGVSVWDEAGKRYGNIVTSLTSDGRVTVNFGSDPMTVPAGTTKNLSVAVSLDSASSSASLNLGLMSVSDIRVSGAVPVQGTFPIISGTFSVVDGSESLGNVIVSSEAVSGISSSTAMSAQEGNLEIGDTEREVFKLRLAQGNSREGVHLKSVTLYVGGNIVESTDVRNWKLYSQQGDVLATAERPIDRFVTFNLATPYFIDKGLTRTFPVKADIMDGSGRYFQVFVQNDYDIITTGATTGASVLLTSSDINKSIQVNTKNDNSGFFKMKQGQLTVSRSANSPSGSIAPSTNNVVLGSFDVKSSGEQLELRKMALRVVRGGAAPALTGSITVKDATTGETYYSVSADTTGLQSTTTPSSWSSSDQMTFSSYIPLSSNQTRTLQVLGSVPSLATSGTYRAHIGNFHAKRFSTNDFTDVGTGVVSGNQLTVQDVTLAVTRNASFASTNRAAGAPNVKIGEFNLQASSVDDILVNTISLNITTSTNFQNVRLMDGNTQLGNTIGRPSATGNSFSVNLTVPKSATRLISVHADLVSNATSSSVVSIATSSISGFGRVSGKALSQTPTSIVAGQTITIGTPSVTIASSDNSALTSRVLIAGTNNVSLGDIKFSAINEDLVLRKITLNLASASTTKWSQDAVDGNFASVKLFDGTTELGSSSVVGGKAVITIPSAQWVTLPQGSDKILTIRADISGNTAISHESVFNASVTSTLPADIEISSASLGIMDTGITISKAETNFYKVQAVVPTIIAGQGFVGNAVGSADSEIGRVTVGKQGDRNIILTGLTLRVQMTGGSASSSITGFDLKDGDSGITVASTTQTLSGPSGSTTTVFTFASTTITTSKTYKLFANTSNIRDGVASTDRPSILVDFVMPATGYSSGDTTDLWTNANITYGYDIFNPTLNVFSGLRNMNKNSDNADTVRIGANTY